ncbi:MAG: hypothetical protein GY820_23965 [Gammaproteobacteria bacterium]|nr:hypothetical protein [Gammaproteobacteria bacterium]
MGTRISRAEGNNNNGEKSEKNGKQKGDGNGKGKETSKSPSGSADKKTKEKTARARPHSPRTNAAPTCERKRERDSREPTLHWPIWRANYEIVLAFHAPHTHTYSSVTGGGGGRKRKFEGGNIAKNEQI